jgi:hypothetical protein
MIWWLLTIFVVMLVLGGALEMGSYIRGQEIEERRTKAE